MKHLPPPIAHPLWTSPFPTENTGQYPVVGRLTFHHGVMTDSDHWGAQSRQWKWSDGRSGPLPPLGSRSHDTFCLGAEDAWAEKQSVHPCWPNKVIRLMLGMLRQNVSGHTTADSFLLAEDARKKWLGDVFFHNRAWKGSPWFFWSHHPLYVNMCHSFRSFVYILFKECSWTYMVGPLLLSLEIFSRTCFSVAC